jgi:hypothetical protein
MDKMTKEEAFQLTRELCIKYDIHLHAVEVRRKKGAMGTAYTKIGKIIYSTILFKGNKWTVLMTVCHEVAHLLAVKRYGRNCMHDRKFQNCEAEIDALYGFKPVYARNRGYAVAYINIETGQALDCRRGYAVKDGRVVIDYDRTINDKILRKVMRAAFTAKAFVKGDRYNIITCEPIDGRLALTVNSSDDKTSESKRIIYQSDLKANNFKINLNNVKYSGKSLKYNIADSGA